MIYAGLTENSIDVLVTDDTGLPVTGLVAATFPPVTLHRAGPYAAVSLTLADLDLITDPWEEGGLFEIGSGRYRLDLPDSMYVALARWTVVGETTNKRIVAAPIEVIAGVEGGIPSVAFVGGQGLIVAEAVTLRETSITAIALGVWSFLKSSAAALATTTIGRFLYDKSAKIGTADGVAIAPVTTNGTEDDPGYVYEGADYRVDNDQPLDFRVTGRPDLTDKPLYLAFGCPPEGDEQIMQVGGGVVISGTAGDQVVRFEPTSDDTVKLRGHVDLLVRAQVEALLGPSSNLRTPVADGWFMVRRRYFSY